MYKSILILLIITSLLTGCVFNRSSEPVRDTRFLLNTICTITIYELKEQNEAEHKQDLISRAFDLIAHYESIFSITSEESDIWRINHAGGEEVSVTDATMDIIKQSLYFSELSEGMFDITIGRLTGLWKWIWKRSTYRHTPH